MDRSVFRAYDIRGVIDGSFNENSYYTIARALSVRLHQLNRQSICVGRDARLTSASLTNALIQGLLDSGIDVVDLGVVSTPVMYYTIHTQGVDSGLMVTGSHNPPDYNGIKMVLAGKTLVQADIDELYEIVCAAHFMAGTGNKSSLDIIRDYGQRICQDIHLSRPLTVVVDCGNGVAGGFIPAILSELGCQVIPLYCEVDGRFPNHHPDPSVEANLTDLKAAVIAHKADIGLAFDGDADRLGVITAQGLVIWPDRLMMYYAQHLLKKHPNATIVYDVKCSMHLGQLIKRCGGVPLMCPTGHSIVKGIMKKACAILAGEMSGHLFFKDRWYGFDDALYSACRLLEIMSEDCRSIDEQFSTIPDSVNTPEIKIPMDDKVKFTFMQRFCEQATFDNATLIRMDGLRVEFAQGFGLIRASNTTPCLVARFEADTPESLTLIIQQFKTQLLKIDTTLIFSF